MGSSNAAEAARDAWREEMRSAFLYRVLARVENGNARGDTKPLAGLTADRIVATMADYRSGSQPATVMHQIVKGYSDAQIRLIAGFFAAQQPAGK